MIFEQLYLITLNIILSLITHVVASIFNVSHAIFGSNRVKSHHDYQDVVSYIVSLAFKNAFTFAKDSSNGL